MTSKSNELKAGIFIFFSIVAVILFIIAITGTKFWTSMNDYYVLMKFAGGLEPGVPVRYGGIKVGEVKEIKIYEKDNSKIQAVFKVEKGTPIKNDSEAFINSLGIMGEYYLEITTGSEESEFLPPESIVHFKEIPTMSGLYEDLKIIEQETRILITNIDNVIRKVNLEGVTDILSSLGNNMDSYCVDINNTLKNFNEVSDKLIDFIGNVDEGFDKNSEHFAAAVKNLNNVIDKSLELADNMTNTLNTLDRSLLMSGKNVDETIDNLNDFSRNLKEFSSRISNRPWIIFRKSYEKERKKK